MITRYLLYFSMVLCCLSANAQEWQRQRVMQVKSKVDSVLDVRTKIRVDTNYISRPSTNWTLKVRGRGYSNFVSVIGNNPVFGSFDSKINIPLKTTLGVSANYRGLSVALAVNPAKLLGKNSSRYLNTACYNNRYGADLSYSSAEDLTTTATIGDTKIDRKLTDSHLQQASASAYYVFNGKRFSYPAAFTHSWIQRRSAGSFLVSAGLYIGSFKSSFEDNTNYLSLDKSISMNHLSIGCGYAYNYVPDKRWLLHISLVPHIIAWHDYRYSLTVDPETKQPLEKKIANWPPGGGGTGRFGVTYNWDKYFTGFSSVVQSSFVGIGKETMRVGNTQWRAEVFWGLRL